MGGLEGLGGPFGCGSGHVSARARVRLSLVAFRYELHGRCVDGSTGAQLGGCRLLVWSCSDE